MKLRKTFRRAVNFLVLFSFFLFLFIVFKKELDKEYIFVGAGFLLLSFLDMRKGEIGNFTILILTLIQFFYVCLRNDTYLIYSGVGVLIANVIAYYASKKSIGGADVKAGLFIGSSIGIVRYFFSLIILAVLIEVFGGVFKKYRGFIPYFTLLMIVLPFLFLF